MPAVATVDGVKIMFYASEHPPPHFHVEYSGDAAVVDIVTATIIAGYLPVAKRRKVLAWTKLNRANSFVLLLRRLPASRWRRSNEKAFAATDVR